MRTYKVVSHPAAGLVVIASKNYGNQLWKVANLRKNRNSRCEMCGRTVGAQGWKPTVDTVNSADRICFMCIDPAIVSAKSEE